jgi:hypothetical protein
MGMSYSSASGYDFYRTFDYSFDTGSACWRTIVINIYQYLIDLYTVALIYLYTLL